MSNLTIPVYVVSLPNSNRRYTFDLKHDFINYSYIDAIWGKDFSKEIEELNSSNWVKYRYKRKISYGEYGCSMSHRKIYNSMIDNNISWALILEDDVEFNLNFQKNITDHISDFDENCIYILGCQEGLPSFDHVVLSEKKCLELETGVVFRKLLKSERYIYRTAAYLISYDVAKRILDFTNDRFCLADDWQIFSKQKLFNDIYLSDFVKHPDLLDGQSLIETERLKNSKNFSLKNMNIYVYLRNLKKFFRKIVIKNIYYR